MGRKLRQARWSRRDAGRTQRLSRRLLLGLIPGEPVRMERDVVPSDNAQLLGWESYQYSKLTLLAPKLGLSGHCARRVLS